MLIVLYFRSMSSYRYIQARILVDIFIPYLFLIYCIQGWSHIIEINNNLEPSYACINLTEQRAELLNLFNLSITTNLNQFSDNFYVAPIVKHTILISRKSILHAFYIGWYLIFPSLFYFPHFFLFTPSPFCYDPSSYNERWFAAIGMIPQYIAEFVK